jgi:segregation and condensation protein B
MSDDWEYESPEYAAPADIVEAEGENAAEAEVAAGAAETDPADKTGTAEGEVSSAAEQATAESASAELPGPRSAKAPLPSPRTEATPAAQPGSSALAESVGVGAGTAPTDTDLAQVAPFDDATWQLSTDMAPLPPLRQCLEAILLVVEEPVADVVLAQITERPRDEVVQTLQELSAEYTEQQRGFDLRQVAGGWRLYTRAACAPLVEKFVLDGQQAKLSQPALETLAVVAYRQPVSRSRISAVRGVNCDGVMRTLLTRGLIEEAGTDVDSGAILYRTTLLFLEKMGMRTLEELPELAPLLPSVESMEESESVA